ncbi:MAG: major capsid protein [Siphoviridae sp. ct7UA22]|nr:MAG: major capsid protein [Siphoviridae sp. ct7UA22]
MKRTLLAQSISLLYGYAAGLQGDTTVSFAGLRGTSNYGADERPKSFRESILFYDPNGSAPLTALMSQMKTESVTDPEFSWWEELSQQRRVVLTTAITTTGQTTLAVAAGSVAGSTGGFSLVPGDLLMSEDSLGRVGSASQEIVMVTAVASDTSITVARGAAGTTALASIIVGTGLLRIGNAFAEGSLSANAVSQNPTKFQNYVQIFKTDYMVTNTDIATKKRTGDVLANEKKRKMFSHANAMEFAYIFGRKSETTGSNGQPLRTTGGLLQFIQSNRVTFGSGAGGTVTWTEDNFIDSLSPCFDIAVPGVGNERIVFCGNGALNEINKLSRNATNTRVNHEGTVKIYGMELTKVVIPQGTLYLRTHPMFNQHPIHRYSMLGIAPKGLRDRVLRATKFNDNIQPPNADYKQGEWITESGLEINFEKLHFFLSNVGNKLV